MIDRNTPARVLLVATALVSASGCAHQAQQRAAAQDQQIKTLTARLDEAERTNGRLNVRIEELEDDVFLLQDRVDANRIALQRKGIMGPRAQANNYQKPSPSPETYYVDERPVTRIPLSSGQDEAANWQVQGEAYREAPTTTAPVKEPQPESDLVITEKEFDDFEARYGGPASSSGAKKTPREAQAPVTAERLATTGELTGEEQPAKTTVDSPPRSRKDVLGGYKDALADYRSGKFREALGGFEAFLASGPQADYLDNALYWIGECYFGMGNYDDAVKYFQRVMSEQPDGNKVPDAMLKMSLADDRVGRGDEAKRLLEDLNRQYPATNAGRLASQKLDERKK